MDEDEKEFIRNQTDVQIWLTACFAFIALALTSTLGLVQITSTSLSSSLNDLLRSCLIIVAIATSIGTIISIVVMNNFRKKMNKKTEKPISISTWSVKSKTKDMELEVKGTNPEEVKELYKLIDAKPEKSSIPQAKVS